MIRFLSTPSARRATQSGRPDRDRCVISIHALREEGDVFPPKYSCCLAIFLSTPSVRRATCCRWGSSPGCVYFYPRPPRGGRPVLVNVQRLRQGISIHALREEGDAVGHLLRACGVISIHTLREEGDPATPAPKTSPANFYPRP